MPLEKPEQHAARTPWRQIEDPLWGSVAAPPEAVPPAQAAAPRPPVEPSDPTWRRVFYCPNCGTRLLIQRGGSGRVCPQCGYRTDCCDPVG